GSARPSTPLMLPMTESASSTNSWNFDFDFSTSAALSRPSPPRDDPPWRLLDGAPGLGASRRNALGGRSGDPDGPPPGMPGILGRAMISSSSVESFSR